MIWQPKRNIQLVNTDLSGKSVDDILAEFVFNEEGTKVLRCPAGYEPKSCGYTGDKSQQFHISFLREQCANCPNKDRCKAKIHKRVSSVTVSVKAHERARQQCFMGTEEFKNLFKIRNGVETVPSLLRRKYHADRCVRGLIRGRIFLLAFQNHCVKFSRYYMEKIRKFYNSFEPNISFIKLSLMILKVYGKPSVLL